MDRTAGHSTASAVRLNVTGYGIRGSSVAMATRCELEDPGTESQWGQDLPQPYRRLWGPHGFLYSGYRVFVGGKVRLGSGVDHQPLRVFVASQLMLYREIMAVCSEIHTKHINTLCGQNVELLNVKLAVHIVTTGLQRVKSLL